MRKERIQNQRNNQSIDVGVLEQCYLNWRIFIFIFDKQTIGAVLTMALGGSCVLIEMFIGDSSDAIKDHLSGEKEICGHFGENTWSLTQT